MTTITPERLKFVGRAISGLPSQEFKALSPDERKKFTTIARKAIAADERYNSLPDKTKTEE